jgi:Tat protein secretion system quality control protein TatD with DNase activity
MLLPHVAAALAAARGESLERCAAYTSANARSLFALPSC